MKRRALVALAIVLLASSAQAAPDFFGLGAVFPGYPSAAGNVSADGTTVVGMSQVPAGSVAFRWRAGALTNLGDLPFGDVQAMAYDVSGNGAFVVGQGNGIAGNEAFRSTLGLISGLGDLPDFDGVFRSAAYGISADGGTIVGVGYGDSGQEAFRWAGGVMTGLGDLPGGNFESTAFDVSANGATIVGEGFGELGHEAFLWTGGVMTGLGTIAGGTAGSAALGVSGDGATVVGYGYNDPFSPEAMRWTSATGMVGLGDLAGGSFYSLARATSADGSIIVGNGTNAAGQEAILWDIAHGMRELDQMLIELGLGPKLAGWKLSDAVGISADGQVIVANGKNPAGTASTWIAIIPEPASGMLTGFGLLGLALLRRR